ncbi:TPA: hypothetical protein ACH3X1_001345 [Trebouxia sp. C0004]
MALTNAQLALEQTAIAAVLPILVPFKKRQKLDVHGMRISRESGCAILELPEDVVACWSYTPGMLDDLQS